MRSGAMTTCRPRWAKAAVALAMAVLLVVSGAACQSSPEDTREDPFVTPSAADVIPVLVSHELVVGENRFVLGLQDRDGNLILDADVYLRFFRLTDGETALVSETDAPAVTIGESSVHQDEDATPDVHTGDEVGVYVAQVGFDEPGAWGVEVTATAEGGVRGPARLKFDVVERGSSPAVGDPAPRSEQTTLRDVNDISEIDTSDPPRPEMHELTIAEAVESGRPAVIAFATPAFCQTRVCGPLMDAVVDPLYERYRDRVAFVHVEPYVVDRAREGELITVPAVEEWGLQTEPWLFVVDQDGRIAGKFEAVVAVDEVEPLLQQLLGESAGRAPASRPGRLTGG